MEISKTNTQSLFTANNNKREKLEAQLKKSISIKKEDDIIEVENTNGSKPIKYQKRKAVKKETSTIDGRYTNSRPSIAEDESFYSLASQQIRVSPYLKTLMKLVDDLELIKPKQESIVGTIKWDYNRDQSVPQIAVSFNGLLIQLIEDYITGRSNREQELFISALKKEINKQN